MFISQKAAVVNEKTGGQSSKGKEREHEREVTQVRLFLVIGPPVSRYPTRKPRPVIKMR